MRSLALSALLVLAVGCKSNPYCLNCKDSGNGVISPADMVPVDLADSGAQDLASPDLAPGGQCVPSNGGVEICDSQDNDCNGIIDDVAASRLQSDPNNCGACGHVCKYAHAFGECVAGPNGTPQCKMGGCQPGYLDRDRDPVNGCEYVCTPSNGGVEICDGKDNNCDGQVDEGFTAHWSDAAHQLPLYDSSTQSCGQCGVVCNLGPGTLMACSGSGPGGRGQCVVQSCFNGDDANGQHQTYRHDPKRGDLNVVGCEYHCPKPATQAGIDCRADGACTFPAETCNGIDDDCDFTVDDNLTEVGLGGPCPDGVPGKLCTSGGANPTCGKGICAAGTYICASGGLRCQGSVGPAPESCDGLDNDCSGKADDPFTATWDGSGKPRYDSDPNHCGGCSPSSVCALPHATNSCRLAVGDQRGSCAVLACDVGFAYVSHTDSNPAKPSCDVNTAKPRDSTQATVGVGCFYSCGAANNSAEICDGADNDCDGCIDNGLVAPAMCANKGVCSGGVTAACVGQKGWKCDYSKVANVSLDGAGNLTATEPQCDGLDNNCNGPCDENFPDVAVSGGTCTNAHAAKSCTAGLGVCQATGPYVCAKSAPAQPYKDTQVCSAVADNTKAGDEQCNGKDDNCNGLIDEPTSSTLGGKTYQGWHDPVVQLAVGADPFTGQAAHTVYVYQYEASRPDSTGLSPGSSSARACAKPGVQPWANVTLAQAQAACAAIKSSAGASIGRLCSAWEWQQACNGNVAAGTHWSMSASTSSYQSGICNDQSVTEQRCTQASQCQSGTCTGGTCTCTSDADCGPGFGCTSGKCVGSGTWPTGVAGTGSGQQCYTAYAGGANAHDLSGNLFEWTSTSVALKSGTKAHVAQQSGQWQVTNLVDGSSNGLIYPSDAGAQLVLSGSANAGDNGTFDVVSVIDSQTVVIANPNAVADGANLTWKFVYNKVRGGSFSSPQGGVSCEFDFDIQKAAFFNNNLGFRCCSDEKP